jgi:Putative beta-barrel porin-2, OmpL-like. bbp2
MRLHSLTSIAGLGGLALALSTASASADALSTPSLAGPLVGNPNPITLDAGPIGNIYVGGVVSGLVFTQSNPVQSPGNRQDFIDLSNAQLFVQKTDGLVQFYVQAGAYNILALGVPTVSAGYFTNHTFDLLPAAYLKLVPADNLSVEAGILPTLIGAENTFDFADPNIERGLLWDQTNDQTRGVQVNYTIGPVAMNLSWNDGYYSDRFNSISGLATWTIDSTDTLAFLGAGNAGRSATSTFITPLLQNNQDIFDLMYTRTDGPWTLEPYLQYSHVPNDPTIGIDGSGSTLGAALLATYNVNTNWNIAARAEYIDSTGKLNLVLGPGSKAWSLTVTPTYQYKIFFARVEASYVTASRIGFSAGPGLPGTGFGAGGNDTDQFRLMLETGVMF